MRSPPSAFSSATSTSTPPTRPTPSCSRSRSWRARERIRPADACDFARYCSALDFFALTDHAEALTPLHWELEKESVRQCDERGGDPADPDLVAFLGFEWTQVGPTPESHYGHKNVIFPGLEDDELPTRPISSLADEGPGLFAGLGLASAARYVDPLHWSEYADFIWLLDELAAVKRCERGVDTRELPADCHENAPTPEVLFEKLAQWGHDAQVIPHGTTWGLYTPPGTSMDKQLTRLQHDPERQRLIEIMSGHGNSEEYRSWREFEVGPDGAPVCPAPTPDYLPCCWRAGEIMRERCGDLPEQECEARVEEAKRLALLANVSPHLVFPDTRGEDWLDCGQCRDCFKPSFGYRPRESVQYSMALSNFDETGPDGDPLRFRYGFIASSDVHTARPGTGYKQYQRRMMTEATGPRSAFYANLARRRIQATGDVDPQVPQPVPTERSLLGTDTERIASFLHPGGLVAVHAEGRNRAAIWQALGRREVYGTSGPRILLWFDLLNGPGGALPMGSSLPFSETPRFEVRAVGAFVQKDGCPEESIRGLSPERLERLCRGECYHASDERHPIVAIEVIRIRPQAHSGENVGDLIEDPVEALRVRATGRRLRRPLRGSRLRRVGSRRALLRAGHPGRDAGRQRGEPARRVRCRGQRDPHHSLLRRLPHALRRRLSRAGRRSAPGPRPSSSTSPPSGAGKKQPARKRSRNSSGALRGRRHELLLGVGAGLTSDSSVRIGWWSAVSQSPSWLSRKGLKG